MVGSARAVSIETACELVDTSFAAALAPKIASAANSVAAFTARAGATSARENVTVLHVVTGLLP